MEEIKVVIGANYGDEGKGQMTDYFCNKAFEEGKSCCVVLSNGGAQRGHTVVTPEGRRHVFKHFGSGTFAHADTYIPAQYIINPLEFCKERIELSGCMYITTVNPNCSVTTPWDMIANMIIEDSRDENRHGSCGMGIWETIQRNSHLQLTWADCKSLPDKYLRDIFPQMIMTYYEERFSFLECDRIDEWKDIFYGRGLCDLFANKVHEMEEHVFTNGDYTFLDKYSTVVFENGQGLLLDRNRKPTENTTPSCTGFDSPYAVILEEIGNNQADTEVCYVTRTYLTRHGAGKFEDVNPKEISPKIEPDETNKTNDYQGALRYGKLDLSQLEKRIAEDIDPHRELAVNTVSLAVMHTNELSLGVFQLAGIDKYYYSDGKTRNEVYE